MRLPLVLLFAGTVAAFGAAFQAGGGGNSKATKPLFVASDRCVACHNGLVTPSGIDVSIGSDWRASMMANASRDPYWQAGVRREITDHSGARGAIENECAICHMPMHSFEQRAAGRQAEVFATIAPAQAATRGGTLSMDGVSCSACHQISEKGLGTRETFIGHFAVDLLAAPGARKAFGPYAVDQGRTKVMSSSSGFAPAQAAHLSGSELCGTCHTLFTHAMDESGKVLGELPEQVPYLEWRHSGYAKGRTCQSCHMPKLEQMPISSVMPQPREKLMQHVFRAGNFFMTQIFARHYQELGMKAQPKELNSASQIALDHLANSAARVTVPSVKVDGDTLMAEVSIRNLAGHKLPTAYPSRRAWIHFTVRNAQDEIVFESGAIQPDGSIKGNDNDADASRYEPHYEAIDSPDKVQIYEDIMADNGGRITTGLLKGVRYIKDNRVLPMGFDKNTASSEVAVQGGAKDDKDFTAGGDRIRYAVKLKRAAGPYSVKVELLYQPIGFRWAQNLRQVRAVETDRLVSMFEGMAGASSAVLASATAVAQ